ncbi:MAG: hypothetical protein GWN00_30330, partial [Aliifodinibius sp.]|nr:hypothetical protein [Fodinibius sp.]NIV15082.1 hypothetical protein [Fodinibius sp.]NIY28928.1 hypothetical protein [Fodinibius sp.]
SIDVFDVDNDATYEIVGASNSSNNGYDGGIILVYDALLHSLELQTQPTSWDEINCITTGNINDTEQGEILVGIEDKIYVFDGQTLQQLWESPELGTINALQLADVDRDNVIEIIVGDYSGYVTVFSGQTFQQEWQSINTGGSIGGIKISNCDQDAAQEIIFFQEQGIIQIYDGETHYLEWQSSAVTNVTALDVGDYNLDGNKEMLTGHSNGMLTVIDCDNHNIVSQNFVANERIEGLLIANVDSVYGLDLLVGTSTLKLLESTNFQTIWESLPLGNNIGDHDNLTTLDVDNDQFMDIFFGSSWGMFHLESSTPYPDITPPAVVSNSPPDSLQFVGLDTDIKASFSEAIDVGTLNNNIVVESNTMDTVSTTITYDENTFTTIATPNNYLPANDTIVVTLTGNIADSSGNGLDGNGNGISEGSPLDDYVWTFYTGTGLDTIGPSITTATVAPDSVWRGIDVIIEAHISDSSHIAVSSVAYAECFVDSVGNFGNGIPLEPTDGAFDSVVEDAILTLDTEVWSFGNHTLYIHAQDANNNWGNIIELNVYVVEELAANWPMFGQN